MAKPTYQDLWDEIIMLTAQLFDARVKIRALTAERDEASDRAHKLASEWQGAVSEVEVQLMTIERELADVIEAARIRSTRQRSELQAINKKLDAAGLAL